MTPLLENLEWGPIDVLCCDAQALMTRPSSICLLHPVSTPHLQFRSLPRLIIKTMDIWSGISKETRHRTSLLDVQARLTHILTRVTNRLLLGDNWSLDPAVKGLPVFHGVTYGFHVHGLWAHKGEVKKELAAETKFAFLVEESASDPDCFIVLVRNPDHDPNVPKPYEISTEKLLKGKEEPVKHSVIFLRIQFVKAQPTPASRAKAGTESCTVVSYEMRSTVQQKLDRLLPLKLSPDHMLAFACNELAIAQPWINHGAPINPLVQLHLESSPLANTWDLLLKQASWFLFWTMEWENEPSRGWDPVRIGTVLLAPHWLLVPLGFLGRGISENILPAFLVCYFAEPGKAFAFKLQKPEWLQQQPPKFFFDWVEPKTGPNPGPPAQSQKPESNNILAKEDPKKPPKFDPDHRALGHSHKWTHSWISDPLSRPDFMKLLAPLTPAIDGFGRVNPLIIDEARSRLVEIKLKDVRSTKEELRAKVAKLEIEERKLEEIKAEAKRQSYAAAC